MRPELSVILATDRWATIEPAVERWRRQAGRERVELILVVPAAEEAQGATGLAGEFARLKTVVHPVSELAEARAAGIRTAAAPWVFVGETHSFPEEGFLEAVLGMLGALGDEWTAITPGFVNGDPNGVWSWAGFLSDYSRWSADLEAGEIPEAPMYNAVYRRLDLLALGGQLADALRHSNLLHLTLKARGQRVRLEPRARLAHLNVATGRHWARERFFVGILVGHHRSRRWSWPRRLAYAAGSPLIPLVLLRRAWAGMRAVVRRSRPPTSAALLVVAGLFLRAAGELAGYLGISPKAADEAMYEYEMHKLAYSGPGAR